ncbi:ABC transporter permease [Halomonas heilongjiangensis]|uniref:ABC transporter permease n=1 Tax=Halomonas heilongjiangensis TaxID=1387883 RepID=A0A2N7TIF8_9GAMM|nr:FtsX-like permease family protein [Halomonas heilongjiangensis]PMR67966.1 ABC transporter permease [Halomonas heilongjiangensis]PXX90515.1 ABC transporter permease [Halomonas heilongjiangensis]
MTALHRKLFRDLWRLKGQALAIAVVIASGVMTLILSVTTVEALSRSQQRFYASHHFAELFADVKRAPLGRLERVQAIEGVNLVEPTVRAPVRLTVDGFDDPVRGLLISLPDGRQPMLNRLQLLRGSLPEAGRDDQAVVSDAFADAHGLDPGDRLEAIIDGRLTRLTISGIALSPEHLYQAAPTDLMPDYRRYAILWMNQRALANAYGMEGAFNRIALTLQAGADRDDVIDALDLELARYGGTGAQTRHDQQSHRFIEEELAQQRAQATILPTIFLVVSAFLLNVLMGRIIQTQREQIAVLKAFGYGDGELARHFAQLAGLIVLLGWALGVGLGAWAATGLAGLYAEYFRFPEMTFRVPAWALALSLLVVVLSALAGTWRAVWRAVGRPPAEAMRPPAPQRFRRSWLERSIPAPLLGVEGRIILRHLARHPAKAGLSVAGIALSCGLLMMGAYQLSAVDRMLDLQYRLVLRMDVELTFNEATPLRAVGELHHQPGVLAVEAWRRVPATLIHGHREYRTSLLGMDERPRLRQLLDAGQRPQSLPREGLVMTRHLAEILGARVGDTLEVAIMEGHRQRVALPLAAVVDEPIGVGAYLQRDALNALMREGPAISGAWLLVDPERTHDLNAALRDMPRVAAIGLLADAESGIRDYMDETLMVFALVFVALAASIAFGVVYNNARIAFAERARELATLQVLGYHRAEVARILLGEIALITLLAIPLGWAIGIGFSVLLSQAFSSDLIRIPLVLTPRAFGIAAAGVLAASLVVALLVIRRLGRLDMIRVLKAVE